MQDAVIVSTNDGFSVAGSVSFDNVVALRKQGEKLLTTSKSAVIDFSELKDQDASPLSLLVCWQRFAKQKKCELKIIHMPLSMQRMGKLFGLNT